MILEGLGFVTLVFEILEVVLIEILTILVSGIEMVSFVPLWRLEHHGATVSTYGWSCRILCIDLLCLFVVEFLV